ncbi:MAG: prepilin-type N-terminal cleavage/methylation domain-containing protein [Phycisphaeraceae bacterium]|nr:prepilin-type N-terminal cleavage/methylation domain-containing protein [Phycisphaeraceae bacterium]
MGFLRRTSSRAYTLIEVLVVVTVLGIAAALVIPEMASAHSLRVQAAVRTIVSDITFAQSDALAMQESRAVVFDTAANSYTLVEVIGGEVDVEANAMFDSGGPRNRYMRDFGDQVYGGARITAAAFDDDEILIFDELGSPQRDPDASTPGFGGFVEVTGSGSIYRVNVDAYTGRVTVERRDAE